MLPFTAEVLSSLVEAYNRALWPLPAAASALALAVVWLALRPPRGRSVGGRLAGAALAAGWAWTGIVFHLRYLAGIDFLAPVYGALFVVQAVLLAWHGAVRGSLAGRFRADLSGWAATALVAYAIAGYPLLAALAGDGWQSTRVVGLAPGPTAALTLGVLLLADGRAPLTLAVVPVLWTLIGGVAAWHLGVAEDLALPLLGVAGLVLLVWKDRRRGGGGGRRAA